RFADVTATNAARILGLYPQKGVIAPGSDADLVLIDPAIRKTLAREDFHVSDYSPWEGWPIQGWPVTTILRGRVVVVHGRLVADAPAARVPWAKPVGDLHHHGAVGRVRARRERRANIYQANPEPVTEVEAEPARLGGQQQERMVERQQPCPDARHPVDVQQVPPDRAR